MIAKNLKVWALAALVGVALVAPVFGDALRDAENALKDALKKNDEAATGAALQQMAGVGGEKAIKSLLKLTAKYGDKLDRGQYWQLIGSMAAFRDAEALDALGEYIVDKERSPISRDLLFSLQNNASHHVLKVHERVLEKGGFEHKLMSVDQLATIKRVESGDLLVAALEREESEQLRDRIVNALSALTGKSDMGDAQNWIGWWKANRGDNPFREETGSSGMGSVTRDGARGGEMGSLERLKHGRVIVISGGACCDKFDHNYDHLESVLQEIGIKAETLNKREFSKLTRADIEDVNAILLNCTQNNEHCICPTCKPTGATNMRMQTCGGCDKHIIVSDKMPAEGIDLIKAFVESGGYFFSEDWGLYEIIEKAWPEVVKVGTFLREADKMPDPPTSGGRDMAALPKGGQVKVTPAPGASAHPYMRGVFLKPESDKVKEPVEGEGTVERGGGRVGSEFMAPGHKWTIDDDSPSVKIIDRRRVRVLLESDELRKLTKGDGTAAFMFPIGKMAKDRRPQTGVKPGETQVSTEEAESGGRVLHVLSHFGKQDSAIDEASLRNMLVNFMLECARRRAREPK